MLADIWKNYPLVTLLVLAALQSVPDDSVTEAARLRRRLRLAALSRHYLSGHCGPAQRGLVLRTIDAFKVFDIIYVMTGGGPLDSHQNAEFFVYQGHSAICAGRQRRGLRHP